MRRSTMLYADTKKHPTVNDTAGAWDVLTMHGVGLKHAVAAACLECGTIQTAATQEERDAYVAISDFVCCDPHRTILFLTITP